MTFAPVPGIGSLSHSPVPYCAEVTGNGIELACMSTLDVCGGHCAADVTASTVYAKALLYTHKTGWDLQNCVN